jgi:PAS domain S-box-containing protein
MARQLSSLKSSLSVIRSAIDSSPAIVVTWGADPAFVVRFISRNISQFGYTPRDFLSGRLNYAALIHPEDVPGMRAHVARVKAAGGREYAARYRLRNARGQWRWVESHVVQEVRRGRPVELYHGIVLDVTDRVTATAASQGAEQAFREITETIRDVFFVMAHPALKPMYVSPGVKTATGFSAAKLLQDPVLWRRTAHPEDLPSVVRALRQCARRGPATLDFRLVHRDGSVRWTQMRVAPVRDERGRVVRITGLHHDISDRKRAESESLRREQMESLIARVSANLTPSRAGFLETSIRRSLGMVGQFLDIDRCVLRVVGPGGDVLSERAAWTRPGVPYDKRITNAILLNKFVWGVARLRRGLPVLIESIRDLPPGERTARSIVQRIGIRSFAFIPLRIRGRLLAVMSLATIGKPSAWPPATIRLGRAIGQLLLKVVQHAAAETEARRREEMEILVARVSAMLARRHGDALARAAGRALAMTGRFLDVDRCMMHYRLPDAPIFHQIGSWVRPGLGRPLPEYHGAPIGALAYIWRRIAAGKATEFESPTELPRSASATRRIVTGLGIRSALVVPTPAWHKVEACIYFSTIGRERRWTPDDRRLARTIGNLIIKATQHSEAEAATREREKADLLLARASRRLFSAKGKILQAQIHRTLRAACSLLGADRALLSRRLPGAPTYDQVASWTRPELADRFPEYRDAPVDGISFIWRRISERKDIIASRLDDLPPAAADVKALFTRLGIRSFILVPVMSWKGVQAGFYFASVRREIPWSPTTIRMARTLGDLIVKALLHSTAEEDVSASEARYRRFTAEAPDAIYVISHDGRIRDANPAACLQAGSPLSGLVGRHVRTLLPTVDRRLLVQIGRRVAREREALLACPVRRSDGRRLMAEIRMTPLPEGDVLAFVRDVTERFRVERTMLQIASREQERIGRDLHDMIGQQLTGVSYLSEAVGASLRRQGVAEARDLARMSDLLQRAVRQTRLIAHNLTAVELAERGLAGAIGRLADETQSVFGIPCEFRNRGADSYPPETARELYLVASEAVTNAVRHGRPGRIRITLASTARSLSLEISDDGHWRQPAGDSDGIGLRVMRHRMTLAGGHLTVEPQQPHGTRVLCVTPRKPGFWSTKGD